MKRLLRCALLAAQLATPKDTAGGVKVGEAF